MGRIGPGNFDSDTAGDYASDLMRRFVQEIEQVISEPHRLEPDEYYGEVIPCIVDIMSALYRLSGTASIPSPDTTALWKRRFLSVFDDAMEKLPGDSRHARDRRLVIQRSFDKLRRLSRYQHEEMNEP